MHSENYGTVVGVFEDRNRADAAVGELLKSGFNSDRIGVAMRHDIVAATEQVFEIGICGVCIGHFRLNETFTRNGEVIGLVGLVADLAAVEIIVEAESKPPVS